VDGRLLLGGGRQLDLEEETTTEAGINDLIKAQLLEDIQSFIAPGVPFEVDLCWSGTMAFGADKNPIVQRVDDHTVAGIRLGGMGVAIGMGVGKELAGLLT
jgi:glycine/D-amino acid oxidase-like deaminating enzyme